MPDDDTSDEAWLKASCLQRLPSAHESGPGCGAVEQHSSLGLDQLHAHHVNNLPPAILHGIFGHLGPRDLCVVSATCQLWRKLNQDKAANGLWKGFYTSRWRVLGCSSQDDVCWQTKYGSKMKQGKSWSGKYESDNLWGHKAGVKALKLLPSHGVLLTGSLDRTIRLWDLTYGMPLSISRPHGGTVRAVALDHSLVASGSSDNVIRLWHARHSTDGSTLLDPAEASAAAADAGITATLPRSAAGRATGLDSLDHGLAESLMELDGPADSDAQHTAIDQSPGGLTAAAVAAVNASSRLRRQGRGPYSVVTGEADEGLFDLTMPGQHLRGHIGPVTSLCLTDSCLYSGSWDYTVRVWRRGSWDCVSVLKYPDWVYSVVARGGLLLVASGPEVHVHDLPTGKLVRKFQNLHEVSVSCLEGTHSGRLLFSGGADGLLMAHDLRMKEPSRVLWHHNAGVNGIALEDPWLVSTASDGTVIMHNLETALPNNFSGCVGPGSSFLSSTASTSSTSASTSSSKRTLGCPGQSGPMYCVDMAESWLAAGGESPAVRTWDFTRAAEAAARAAAARAARGSSKKAKSRRAAAAAAGEREAAAAMSPVAANERQVTKRGGKGSRVVGESSSAARHSPAAGSGSWAAAASGVSAAQGASSSSSAGTRLPRGLLAAAAAAAAGVASADAAGSNAPPGSGDGSRADRFHKLQSRRSNKKLTQQDAGGSSSGGGGSGSDGAAGADGQRAEGVRSGTSGDKAAAGSFLAAAAAASGSTATAHDHCSAQASRRSSSAHRAAGLSAASECGASSYGGSPQGRGYWQGQQHGSIGGWHGSSPVQHGAWLGGSSPPVGSSRLHQSSSSGRRHSSNGSTPVPSSHLSSQQQVVAGGRSGIAIPAGKHTQHHHRRPVAHTDAAPAGGCDAAWSPYGASPCSGAAGGFEAGANTPYAAAAAAGQPSRGVMYGSSPAGADDAVGPPAGDRYHRGSHPAPATYQVPFSSSYPSAAQGPGPWLVPGSSPRYEVWGTTLRIAAATNADKRLAIKRPEASASSARRSGDGGGTSSQAVEAEEGLVAGSFSN